jgi:hypothetical protein
MRPHLQTLVLIIGSLLAMRTPTTPQFPEPIHYQYLQDTIQRPIPQHQIRIHVYEANLPNQTIGQTFPIKGDQYVILLNPTYRDQWTLTLLHELVHVKQFETHKLEWDPITHQWSWLHGPIDWTKPWSTRPWEQEADLQASRYLVWYQTMQTTD